MSVVSPEQGPGHRFRPENTIYFNEIFNQIAAGSGPGTGAFLPGGKICPHKGALE